MVFLRGSITACACLWAMAAWHALVSWAPRPLTQAGVITGYLTEQFGKVLHRFGLTDFCFDLRFLGRRRVEGHDFDTLAPACVHLLKEGRSHFA
ncbi:hypothetical protein D3C71_1469350 [compost metagenome]